MQVRFSTMKSVIENENPSGDDDGNDALRRAFKRMNIRKGVCRFRSHEDAGVWWKEHCLSACRKANEAHSGDLFFLRQLFESQGITPPE